MADNSELETINAAMHEGEENSIKAEVADMHRLVKRYRSTCRKVEGCGIRGEEYLDIDMKEIDEYIAEHPDNKELPALRPVRQLAEDDGNDGAKTAIGNFGSSYCG